MSSVSKTSSSTTTPRRGLLSKMFQKPVSTQTHPYPHPSTSARGSESTLVSPSQNSSKDEQRDPDAVFGALASTYGWGGAHIPALPPKSATTRKSKKTMPQQNAAVAPPAPSEPLRRPLTQAQREQAIVDLSSRYYAFPAAGRAGRM